MGALYALPLTIPFLVIDSISERAGSSLYSVGLFGIPLAAIVVQVREARSALREQSARLGARVTRAALPFFAGVVVVVFIAFVPVARALGTFDIVDDTSIPGELFFLLFAGLFAVATLITAGLVVAVAAVLRRFGRDNLRSASRSPDP